MIPPFPLRMSCDFTIDLINAMLTLTSCEAFFHRAQLSGIVTTIVSLLLAVLAQVIAKPGTGAVAILSILFPPMNYTFFAILMARWERQDKGTNLTKAAPENPSTLPGIAFFIFAIIQTLAFPILGAIIERTLYGTASEGRQLTNATDRSGAAVQLINFTKCYTPSLWARKIATRFGKRKETVTAVDDLNLTIPQGQIMVLLGANGSGKSTTLEAISGLNTITSGTIAVDGYGGLGICPQKNVLWDNLTAFEHVKIFNRLKSTGVPSSKEEMHELIAACDLDRKVDAQSRHLSGGQKRKLQLRYVRFCVKYPKCKQRLELRKLSREQRFPPALLSLAPSYCVADSCPPTIC